MLLFNIGVGQLIAIGLVSTGVFTKGLEDDYNVHTPTLQLAFMYGVLIPYFLSKKARAEFLVEGNWWKLLICAIIDSQASLLIVEAYTLTSLTSIFILNTTSVPVAFLITKLFFKVTYKKNHYIALGLCLLGALMAII